MFKKMVYIVSLTMLFTSLPAEAKFGGGRSMGGSSGRSMSMPRNTGGGMSQGQNAGMQRGNVMNDVRSGKTPPANAPAAAPAAQAAPGGARANSGFSTGTLLGTAAVAGLVGYMMHRDNNGNTYYTNPQNPNTAYDSNGNPLSAIPQGDFKEAGVYQGQAAPGQRNQSGGFGWLTWLLILGGGFWAYRRFIRPKMVGGLARAGAASGAVLGGATGGAVAVPTTYSNPTGSSGGAGGYFRNDAKDELNQAKEQFFLDFQKNNRPSQINFIRKHSDPAFFAEIEADVLAQPENKVVDVNQLQSQLVDFTENPVANLASVRYIATLIEDGSINHVDEVWHFSQANGKWLLAGIEQV